jgi:aminopeptidase N
MLACFEHWFGPYPWYEDGYKLVETPHLGMEHQSAVAYGNHYLNGYLGRDLSGTGLGLKWDFIIVHESAHEWFGNSLTSKDLADMWVHESFANYAEALYTECQQGKEAGATYVIGVRKNVRNDEPIVAPFGVNAEGSGDMYYKGGNMLHTIRQLVNDDEKWRSILRGLQSTYRHQVVTGKQVEDYISRHAGIDLSKVFRQYLETTKIPVLEWRVNGTTLSYRWTDVVPGFDMPVRVAIGGESRLLRPTEAWQTTTVPAGATLTVDRNFYVKTRYARTEPRRPTRTITSAGGNRVARQRTSTGMDRECAHRLIARRTAPVRAERTHRQREDREAEAAHRQRWTLPQ